MNPSWQIRPYMEGDEQQILRLRHVVFGDLDPVRLKPATWYWQFRDNPAGKPFCFLAEDHGAVVGQYAVIPTRFSLQGEEKVLGFSCDTMIHPDYRNQGIFSTLARELYRWMEFEHGINSVWGFPNETSLPGFTRHLGWELLAAFPLKIIPIRPVTMLCRHIPLFNRIIPGPFLLKEAKTSVTACDKTPQLRMEPIHHFGPEFDELWATHRNIAPVVQVRDSSYLNWRYLGVPEFDYRSFAIQWKGEFLGYLIIRMMVLMRHSFGVLVDLFPFPIGDDAFTGSIFAFARRYCREHGGEFLTCLISSADSHLLKRAGWKKIPHRLNPKTWYFGCRPGEKEHILLSSAKHWHITYGDTDVV